MFNKYKVDNKIQAFTGIINRKIVLDILLSARTYNNRLYVHSIGIYIYNM